MVGIYQNCRSCAVVFVVRFEGIVLVFGKDCSFFEDISCPATVRLLDSGRHCDRPF